MDQGLTAYQGWAGNGTTAPYFHNVRAVVSFGLAHGSTVRGRTYLALGSFATLSSTLATVLAKRPPFGVLDSPAAGAVSHGVVPLAGWVLGSAPLAQVQVELDAVQVATLPVTGARADVCAAYPDYAGCPTVGYSGTFSTAGLDACTHLLRVVAVDAHGNRSVLGERLVQR